MSLLPASRDARPPAAVQRIGCVSFLNAKPLIDGLEDRANPAVRFHVPSGLLHDLDAGDVDIALCPVIDYQRSVQPLDIVPVGGIGCDGPTLTVRLFSRVPIRQITRVYADTDSHTSVALMRVLLAEVHDLHPAVIDYHARQHLAQKRPIALDDIQSVLLIGDKVVTDCPAEHDFPHQIDLGEAWKKHTGLPFVFAVWMARRDAPLGDLPALLLRTRLDNADRIDELVQRHAPSHGWPADLARQYLGHWLKYHIGPEQLAAIQRFHASAHRLGLTPELRPLAVRPMPPA